MLAVSAVALLLVAQPGTAPRPLAIVVNRANPTADLRFTDLRKIFLGERAHWDHGRRITLVMQDRQQPEHAAALQLVYGMDDRTVTRDLLRAVFTGVLSGEPKRLSSSSAVQRFIFNVPGAIGYVWADEVNAAVKVVKVDGRLPGEPGYPLVAPPP